MKNIKTFGSFINESITDDETLIDNIENLTNKDLEDISMNVRGDFEDVDKETLIAGILNVFGKINPSSVEKQKNNVRDDLFTFNNKLVEVTWKGYSAIQSLKDYFKDNLQIFKV
jgi:hypothetical protein